MPLRNFSKGGGKEKLNFSQEITVLAENQISIGDTVYVVRNEHSQFLSSLTNIVYSYAFSPDKTRLIVGGYFTGRAKLYTVDGTTITYVSDIYADNSGTALSNTVRTIAFNPDGTSFVLGGEFSGNAKIYTISDTTITYVSDIYENNSGTMMQGVVSTAIYNSTGTVLLLGGQFTGYAKIYTVNGTSLTYINYIYGTTYSTFSGEVQTMRLSSDDTVLVVGGAFTGYAKIYTVNGTTVTYVSDIYADNSSTALNNKVRSLDINSAGTQLVLGGAFTGYGKLYTLTGTTVTFISNIYSNNSSSALNNTVYTVAFSPDGTKLIVGGYFTGYAKYYTVSESTLTYVADINNNNNVYVAFFIDNTILLLGGYFTGYAKVYSLVNNTVTYITDIYANTGDLTISNNSMSAAFSPDGTKLIIGDQLSGYAYSGYAKLYTVSETVLTYITDIYADNNNTALNGIVYSITFSPDGSKFVLGGMFTGYGKLYSLTGTTVTFISNIYADNYHGTLSYLIYSAAFSPDGTKLVIGGQFTGYAKIYTVNGTTLTFVSNIYANTGTTTLSSYSTAVAFSPDGTKLVIGGDFTGKAKLYSISGTTVTYVSDIYADNSSTALSNVAFSCKFLHDGTKFVLGGAFTGYAKLYTLTGTTVTYITDIYANSSSTTLAGNVYTIVFTSNDSKFILGGQFTGKAKMYTISGTTVTYISDIYADSAGTPLNNTVYTNLLSNDDSILFLGGLFAGYAKLYLASDYTHPVNYVKSVIGTSSQQIPKNIYSIGYSNNNILVNTTGTVISIALMVDHAEVF